MWHLTKIPKNAHFFWDDRPLSFLRWLSVYSFSTLNPDWNIKFHITKRQHNPSWPSQNNKHVFIKNDYRGWLKNINAIEIAEETDLPNLHGVHQSDILRNRYLSSEGGLWSDIDILYYKPMHKLTCNKPENNEFDCGLCITGSQGWMPIAFMLGAPKSSYYQDVYNHQLSILRTSGNRGNYQKFGTKVYKNILNTKLYPFFKINPKEIYQCNWRRHGTIFAGNIDLGMGIGIHWYGGSPSAAAFEPIINHDNWNEFPIKRIIEVTYETQNHGSHPNINS